MEQHLISTGVYRFIVPAEQAGQRLDQFLAGALSGGRGVVKRLIDLGGAHVDGRRIRRCSLAVAGGQSIELHVDGLPLEPFRLDVDRIVYRDRYLLVLDKPPGVATQPTPARYQGTVYAAVLQFLGESGQASLGMVQRLDRDTSGVMVFSIHPRAHKGLTAAFGGHRVTKRYLALIAGCPQAPAGEIRSQLARRRATNRMVSVERGGKPAITRYRVIASCADAALVEVEIPTGRSHQIRVHFAEAGHPLLGDRAYGGPTVIGEATLARQMLHAAELCLDHPVDGRRMEFRVPPPEDFQEIMRRLFPAA